MPTSSSSCSTYDVGSSDENEPIATFSPSKSKYSPSKSPKHSSVAKKYSVKLMDSTRSIRTTSVPREGSHSLSTKRLSPHNKVKEKLMNKLAKSSSASSLQNLRLKQPNRKSPLANELAAKKLRARPSNNGNHAAALTTGKKESSSSNDDLSSSKKMKSEPKSSVRATPFQIEEPVVVGDYSNPFEGLPNPSFYQQKMCDAIDLNRYLGLADNLGFSKRPVYRPFLMRNLSYMKRTVRPASSNYSHDANSSSHVSTSAYSQDIKSVRTQGMVVKSELPKVVNRMPSSIKFNFIRNNLCFGDRSAIVQCFHASEINYALGSLKRIPSSTFDMKVNEKLNHISIDLPENFGAGFMNSLDSKSRVEYFVVRVVFRYEDAEVGGGKRLRKVPSRQIMDRNARTVPHRSPSRNAQEVVMFGTKQIVSFLKSEDGGLSVVHGETSIVLHSSEDLKIAGNLDGGWMEDSSFLARILKLQRKNFDNPFMSIEVQNTQDEDDEEEDEEEEDGENGSPLKSNHSTPNGQARLPHQSFESTCAGSQRFHSASPMTTIPFVAPTQTNSFNQNLPEKIALQFLLNFEHQAAKTSTNIITRSSASSRESSIPNGLSKDDENFDLKSFSQEEAAEEKRIRTSDANDWLLRNLNIGSPMELTENMENETTQKKYKIRVLNSKYMCFFCLTQISFPSLQGMLFHLRLCHARFKFTHENVLVSKNLKLSGFSVTLNDNFDSSYEMNPSRHYVKLPNEKSAPKKRIVVAPIWIVIKNLARTVRSSMVTEGFSEFDSFLLDRDISFSDGIRNGTRYCFEPPTKINHPWLMQANSRNLSEITDLHHLERAMMKLWNDFLLEIRITHLGKNMAYKASRVFVENYRDAITQQNLRIHLLFHLTNLVGVNCIDEEERYDLFMRLDSNYNPRYDTAHFVCKQFDILEMESTNQGRDRLKIKTSSKHKMQGVAVQEAGGPTIIECLDDLKSMYPFASSRRLEKIWKFMDSYSLDDFPMTIV